MVVLLEAQEGYDGKRAQESEEREWGRMYPPVVEGYNVEEVCNEKMKRTLVYI